MSNDYTLREFFIKKVAGVLYENSFLHDAMSGVGFIFKALRGEIGNCSDLPKLTIFLTSYPFGGDGDHNSTYLDEQLIVNYGSRKMNSVIDNYRYDLSGDEILYQVYSEDLARNIITLFGKRWEEYINEIGLVYNPIHNYDMNEHEEVNSSVTVSGDNTNSVQGFNSTSFKPESKTEDTHTTSGDKKDNYRDLTRKGNIGVTTSQQMLEAEINLRDNNILVKRLLLDVANYITVGVYD